MLNFLKSKKGFTLVELMIVVVIMAILVAVAVPIFSAVTKSAREKTCIGNQREIISSVGGWLMLLSDTDIEGKFTVVGGQDNGSFSGFDGLESYEDSIKGLFKTVPVCPDDDSTITVKIESIPNNGKANVYTKCSSSDVHKVPGSKEPDSWD